MSIWVSTARGVSAATILSRGASSIGAPRRIGERESFRTGYSEDGKQLQRVRPTPWEPSACASSAANGWADLRGATTCAVDHRNRGRSRPCPLGSRPAPQPSRRPRGIHPPLAAPHDRRRAPPDGPVGVAGIGNIYRAEVLFRQGIDPWTSGQLPGRRNRRALLGRHRVGDVRRRP